MICISQFMWSLHIWCKETGKNLCPIYFTAFEDLLCILDLWSYWSIFSSSTTLPFIYHSLPFVKSFSFLYLLLLFLSFAIAKLTFMYFSICFLLFLLPLAEYLLYLQVFQHKCVKIIPFESYFRRRLIVRSQFITQLYYKSNSAKNQKWQSSLAPWHNKCLIIRI